MKIERLFTYHVELIFDGVGSYELYSVPNDGSRMITVTSPVHEDCEIAFQYREDINQWVSANIGISNESDTVANKQFTISEFLHKELSQFTDGFLNLY